MALSHKIEVSNFNLSVRPQDDFFDYANGGWINNNPIPEDQVRWGSFYLLNDEQKTRVRELLEDLLSQENLDQEMQKVKILYRSGLDIERINTVGLKPLEPILNRIDNLSPQDIAGLLSDLHLMGYDPLFRSYIFQDEKNVEKYIPYFFQAGIGLPDRDYYLSEDENMRKIQEEYVKAMGDLLGLAGFSESKIATVVPQIYEIEKSLAKASMSQVDLRNPDKTYHKMTFAELSAAVPGFDWKMYFEGLKIPLNQDVVVNQPLFLAEVARMCSQEDLEKIKNYLRWVVIRESAPFLADKFADRHFAFFNTVLTGQTTKKPRWYRVINHIDGIVGFSIGKIYVKKYFSENAKNKMAELTGNILAVLKSRVEKIDWMSDTTKENAYKKLATFMPKLGYPDVWPAANTFSPGDDFMTNILAGGRAEFERKIARLGKPVDKNEWEMTPQTVNAYYHPSRNEIVFPAAILQPPFFHEDSEDALNYGGIGSVIAHEITHGFDDQGSKYDHLGNLAEWWTADDRKQFMDRARILVDQFNSLSPLPGMNINGELTLGENLADLGGLLLAFEAYQKSLIGKPTPPVIDGLTHEQRFFVRFAECECMHARPEMIKKQLLTDPHSPSKFRVNAILPHSDDFYRVFGVTENDPMYLPPEKRARVW